MSRLPVQRCALLRLAVVLLLVPRGAFAQSTSLPDVARIARQATRAVVWLHVYDAAGSLKSKGSGFLVAGGRVVTNRHVIEGGAHVEIIDHDGRHMATARYAEAVSTSADLAVLPAPGGASAPLRLAATRPAVGERIVVIGAPEGLTNTVSDGIVSAFRILDGASLMQISAPTSLGSSGGPVLNSQGEVVGVSVSMMRQGQNLNFAVPAAELRALLREPTGQVAFPTRSVPPPAVAAEEDRWLLVAQTSGVAWAIDVTRIDAIGGELYQVWEREAYNTVQGGEPRYNLQLTRRVVDCRRMRSEVVKSVAYLNHTLVRLDDKPVGAPTVWDEAVPGSYGETILLNTCRHIRQRGS